MTAAGYGAFGVVDYYDSMLGDLVYGGELDDRAAVNETGEYAQLSPEEALERLWGGMLAEARPLALIGGECGQRWPHVREVALQLLRRTAGKQMRINDGPVPEWMGIVLETHGGLLARDVRELAAQITEEFSEDDVERLVIAFHSDASMRHTRYCYRLIDTGVGLLPVLYRGQQTAAQVAVFQRRLERREPERGRALLLADGPRPPLS